MKSEQISKESESVHEQFTSRKKEKKAKCFE